MNGWALAKRCQDQGRSDLISTRDSQAFQSDSTAVVKTSEPKAKGEPIEFPSFGLDPRSVGLPGQQAVGE